MQKCDDEDDVEENDGEYVLAVSDGLSEDALERTLGVVYERSGRPPGQQVPPPVTPARGGGLGWVPSSVGRWREACRLGVPPRPPPLLLLLHPAQQREPDALRLRHDGRGDPSPRPGEPQFTSREWDGIHIRTKLSGGCPGLILLHVARRMGTHVSHVLLEEWMNS